MTTGPPPIFNASLPTLGRWPSTPLKTGASYSGRTRQGEGETPAETKTRFARGRHWPKLKLRLG